MATEGVSFELRTNRERAAQALRLIRENRSALLGVGILFPMFFLSAFAPVIAPYDPTATHVIDKFAGPGGEYLLGTDALGRDLLSRVLYGGRTTLILGLGAVGLALSLGVPIGLVAGYIGGRIDELLMRFMDVLLSFPTLLLALLIVSILSSNVVNAILAIGIVYAPRIARIVRGSTLSIKNEEFVQAAEARGESHVYIMFGEILPNILSPLVVEGSIRIGFAIIVGSSLSFLGLGAQPPQPDWGYMIAQSRQYIWQTPWFLLWPSLFLGLTVLGFNLLGDGLREILDPRITGEEV